MITIDKEIAALIDYVRNIVDDDFKLRDLSDLYFCKCIRAKAIKNICDKNNEKGKEFYKENCQFLEGVVDYNNKFYFNVKQYIEDTELDIETERNISFLNEVILKNSYFPINQDFKDRAILFITKYENIYSKPHDYDEAVECLKVLKEKIFEPCRLYDCNFDKKIEEFNGDVYKINFYLFTIGQEIGRDQEAENLAHQLERILKRYE